MVLGAVFADILRGRRATCFFAIKDDVVNAGALYETPKWWWTGTW